MKDEIFRITKAPNRAKALFEMAEDRFKDIKNVKKPYKIIEEYYEIIKELITAIMYFDGFKTLSHLMLVVYLKKNYKEFSSGEIILIDELRKLRNEIVYYGLKVPKEFLINKEKDINSIIKKLFKIVDDKT